MWVGKRFERDFDITFKNDWAMFPSAGLSLHLVLCYKKREFFTKIHPSYKAKVDHLGGAHSVHDLSVGQYHSHDFKSQTLPLFLQNVEKLRVARGQS